MDWKGLRNYLFARHPAEHQKSARIDFALRQAEEALTELSRLGYQYHLADGPGEPYPSWPCLMFHVDAAPNGRLVRSEAEAAELGPGWFRTLMESQLWDGMETQFAGRGGVPRTSLPALGPGPDLIEVARQQAELERVKNEMIEMFKAGRQAGTSTGAGAGAGDA